MQQLQNGLSRGPTEDINDNIAIPYRARKFCEYYIIHQSKMRAARESGYQGATPIRWANQLLKKPYIVDYIRTRKKELLSKIESDQLRTLQGIGRCAFANIKGLFDDENNLKDLADIDDNTAYAIESIEVTDKYDRNEKRNYSVKKVKMVDKKGSLEMLGKFQGLFKDDIKGLHIGDNKIIIMPEKVPIGAPVDDKMEIDYSKLPENLKREGDDG